MSCWQRYGGAPMREQILIIALLWLTLQFPLGSFIGDCLRFGMTDT